MTVGYIFDRKFKQDIMKSFRALILSVFILAPVFAAGQDIQNTSVRKLTLDEAVDYALKHSENVQISELDVDIAHAQTGEYLAQGFPQIDASATFNKNFIIRKTFVPANIFDPNASPGDVIELQFGTPYDGNIGLNFSQMIFNGSYFVGIKAAKTLTDLSRKELKRSKIDVVEGVIKAYYSVLVNKVGLDLVQTNYNRLDSLLRETRIMQENGFAEKIDISRTQVEFNNVKTQLESNRRMLEISKGLLKFQMGMPLDEEIDVSETLSDLNLHSDEILAMKSDFHQRIEYSTLETNLELAQLDMKNNTAQYLPRIDLNASWGLNAGVRTAGDLVKWGNRRTWPDYQLAGIAVYIPIFDGLEKAKKIQQNKLKIEQLQFQQLMLKKNISLEVSQKKNSFLSAIQQVDNQKENMALAKEVYDHSKIKYQEGVGSNLEVIEADHSFKQAQTNYFNALYEALIAKVELEKALGIIDTKYKF